MTTHLTTHMKLPAGASGMHRFSQMERVVYGRAIENSLEAELKTLDRRRVFVVANRSLSRSDPMARIRAVLGDRLVGEYAGVTAHTPRECVIEGARAAKAASADLLLAVGGGSVIDGTKAMLLCLRHGIDTPDAMQPYANVRFPDTGHAPPDAAEWLRMIAVPTTLSGAEFASSAGVTDMAKGMKHAFVHPMMMPQSILMDPSMTLATPLSLLLSTGIKAIDHAAERMTSSAANPFSDAVSSLSLRLMSSALRRLKSEPEDLGVRADLQYGMFMSLAGSAAGVAVNVSHAIGHVLGAHAGVAHGDTSCVLLPAVLRWNSDATGPAQAAIAQALGRPDMTAGAAIGELVSDLGMVTRLRDTPLKRDDFAAVADKAMHESLLANSRKPVTRDDVTTILESAW